MPSKHGDVNYLALEVLLRAIMLLKFQNLSDSPLKF